MLKYIWPQLLGAWGGGFASFAGMEFFQSQSLKGLAIGFAVLLMLLGLRSHYQWRPCGHTRICQSLRGAVPYWPVPIRSCGECGETLW